jgi:phospholipid/cholesterol/gamma-HCH transport system substrate-binding protein
VTTRVATLRRGRRSFNEVPLGRLAIAAVVVGAVLYGGWILHRMGFSVISSGYTLSAEFSDAGGLGVSTRNPVVINGVPEGRLTAIHYRNGLAVATLSMTAQSRGYVHSDATIELIPRSALQDVAIDIHPGTESKPALGNGATIGSASTSSYVGVDGLTDIFDADTRSYADVVLQELDTALHGVGGPLRADLQQLAPTLDDASQLAGVLSRRRLLLAGLVTHVDLLFTTLGHHGSDLAAAIRLGEQTVGVTAARDTELASSVQELPATLTAARAAFAAVQRLSAPLVPAIGRLEPAARALAPAVGQLRAFIPVGERLTRSLGGFVAAAPPGVSGIDHVLTQLGSTASTLDPGTAHLSDAITPLAKDLAPGTFGQLMANVSGVFSINDAVGPIARGAVVAVEPPLAADFGLPSLGSSTTSLDHELDLSLNLSCLLVNAFACDFRTLTPGLPEYLPASERRLGP